MRNMLRGSADKVKAVLIGCFSVFDKLYNALVCKYRKVSRGANVRIRGKLCVCGRGSITIGDGVAINTCRRANPIGGDTRTILNTVQHGTIRIGARSGLSNCTIVSRESVTIGEDVRIGGSCRIYDTDFHAVSFEDRIINGDHNVVSKPVVIKDGAFIGAFSIILKGVTVGKHSVVGAGSVVTKNSPDGEVWGGNPAKFIKKLEE